MDNWLDTFEHTSLAAPEAQEAFKSAMSKYGSQEDAVVGGFEAMKAVGKPFKLPESLDKLPDDTVRGEFTSQAHKLLGIETAENIEALTELDMKAGQAEGALFDEGLANSFKAFVVEKKINKANAQEMVGFYNQTMAKARIAIAAKAEADKLAAAKTCNEALIAHPDFGSAEKVAEQSELLRRSIQNCPGITPEEYEEVGEELANSMLTKNPVMARVMLKLLAPLAAEGSTDTGAGGKAKEKELTGSEQTKKDLPKTAKALGWNE